jgi:DNA (cytosine-5)-methyltransferase 1
MATPFDEEAALRRLQLRVERANDDKLRALERELSAATTVACADAKNTPANILDAVKTIVNNKAANKYLFSIAVTCCLKKMVAPAQDIRIVQDRFVNGYSNRSLDQRHVTPFLKRHGYTHCEASGVESGRNLENPLPWNLDYPCNPRGRGNRESFLGLLHHLEEQGGNPETIAVYLLWYDRAKAVHLDDTVVPPLEDKISKIMRVFERHFNEGSGQGKSRLPVLALYAVYSRLIVELARYDGCELLALERHTTADLRSGSIGDIQVNKDGSPFEGVEIKSEKPITAAMVNELERKFAGKQIARYYILTTRNEYVRHADEASVADAIRQVEQITGCQIIVNGLKRTLWYYLRLLSDPSAVLREYQALLDADEDIRVGLKNCWNQIIAQEYPS